MPERESDAFEREFRVYEALDVNSSTPGFALSFFTGFATLFVQIGFQTPPWYAFSPLLIIIVIQALSLRSYFKLRNLPRPKSISDRRMRTILITSLLLGTSWGMFVLLTAPYSDANGITVLYMVSFFGGFGATSVSSRRVIIGFSVPIFSLAWLAMVLYGPLGWLVPTMMTLLSFLSIWQFAARNMKSAAESIRATLANTKSMADRLAAEENLRKVEIEAAQVEQERQQQLSQMQRDLVNAVPFPLVLTHKNEALEITPQAREQYGLENVALSDFTLTDFFRDPEDQEKILQILGAKGKLDDYEVLMHNSAGEDFWVTLSMRPLQYDGRDCWLNAIYVIDARKRMEEDLAEAKTKAEHALEELKTTQQSLVHAEKMASLGQLTAGIAHEIKNPLNFVNNFSKLSAEMMDELAELLEEPVKSLEAEDREDAEDLIQTVRENLIKIDEHGRRADSIVKNMLLHSREGTGEKQLVDLNALAKEALNLAYHGARATDKEFNVDLATDFATGLDKIACQPQDLQRVILNLCSNGMYEAVKEARNGGEPARLEMSTQMDGDYYVVHVKDNGGGIPQAVQDKIFNPFFTTKPTGEGTGLGLSMSFDIVKQHGGEMSFDTDLGKGTTFHVRLPKPTTTT